MQGVHLDQEVLANGRFYIKTFGCQMNVADTERMEALLSESGMSPAADVNDANVIVINGCSVREKAVHKAVSMLGTLKPLRKASPSEKPIIGIGGCVGQLEKESLFKNAPYLDFVFGTDAIDQLPEMIFRAKLGERKKVYAEFDPSMSYSTQTKVMTQKAQAFVNIMKGCDKYCTYCIVPFTRGKEKSRTIDEVLDDMAALAKGGAKEITLLGQNVNSFGKGNFNEKARTPLELHNIIGKVGPAEGEENFPQLLRAIEEDERLESIKRIRFTSSHPLDFSDELIECYGDRGLSKLCNHLHLPVQSGSNRILRKMGRKHQIEHYVEQMRRLRELSPDVGIGTDLIVGFPTETEEDFQETLRLLDTIECDSVYAFAYSPRPGTRASKLEDDVPNEVKNDRLNRLLSHQLEISKRRHELRVGKRLEVLVEGLAKNQNMAAGLMREGMTRVWTGRTSCARVVNFKTDSPRNFTGQFIELDIESVTALSLTGKIPKEQVTEVRSDLSL